MAKRVKLTVAYDGTNYCGWQIQPNGNTIEAELNRHLSELLGHPVRVIGASRTDAGVHALGNVAVFDTTARMPAEKTSFAMNTRLPRDIKIQKSEEVAPDFHPRYCDTRKTYEYRICNRTFPNPLWRLYSLHYYWPLDEGRMQEAANYLVGTHDFSSLCTHRPGEENRVRTIEEASVRREGDIITIRLVGSGFLYNMVRIIAGTLIRIGSGAQEPGEMADIIAAKDRAAAGDTARPEGLTLIGIEYL